MYSNPPTQGARIVATVMDSPELYRDTVFSFRTPPAPGAVPTAHGESWKAGATKTGEVMNLAAETIQSSVEGVPLVSNRGKDDKGKKATAAGEKHAIALLDGALDARQQAMVAEIDAHMHHPSVAPHAARLR